MSSAQRDFQPVVNDLTFVESEVSRLLNELTTGEFELSSNYIIAIANRSENERDGATLLLIVQLIFEKAIDEPDNNETYARLCLKIRQSISLNIRDESMPTSAGQPITGGKLFRQYLHDMCQEEFWLGWADKERTAAAASAKAAEDIAQRAANEGMDEERFPYSNEYYAAEKAKRRGLGIVKFIGELFNLSMLTERLVHECIKQLLSNTEDPEEDDIESLCRLLITVGQAVDTERARNHMNVYFDRMTALTRGSLISSRLKDTVQVCTLKWRVVGFLCLLTNMFALLYSGCH